MNIPERYMAVVLSAAVGVFGAGYGSYIALGRQMNSLQTEVHTQYCTKAEQEKALDRIYSSLVRIEDKLDGHITAEIAR